MTEEFEFSYESEPGTYQPENQDKDEMAHIFDGDVHPAIKKLQESGFGICAMCGHKHPLDKLENLVGGNWYICKSCKDSQSRRRI